MMTSIKEYLNKLNYKIETMFNDISLVDVNSDGLIPKSEAGVVINGLSGPRGSLVNGTDLNNVTFGGIYYLPSDKAYGNVPFKASSGSYRMQLEVVRNYGSDPRTNDPLVYQKITTIEAYDNKIATRFYYGGWPDNHWSEWHYEDAIAMLWSGSQVFDGSNIVLASSLAMYNRISISWQPYNRPTRTFDSILGTNVFNDVTSNVPDEKQTTDTPAVSIEEINILIGNDKQTLTLQKSSLYYLLDSAEYSDEDSGKAVLKRIVGYKEVQYEA